MQHNLGYLVRWDPGWKVVSEQIWAQRGKLRYLTCPSSLGEQTHSHTQLLFEKRLYCDRLKMTVQGLALQLQPPDLREPRGLDCSVALHCRSSQRAWMSFCSPRRPTILRTCMSLAFRRAALTGEAPCSLHCWGLHRPVWTVH